MSDVDHPRDPAEAEVPNTAGVDLGFDRRDLEALFAYEMPFGRFAGTPLLDLPEEYLMWFERHGFPAGKLGRLMQLSLGIKRHGAEPAVKACRDAALESRG